MGIADHNSERRLSARMLHEPTRALAVSQDSDGSTLPATRSGRTAAHLQRLRGSLTGIELSSQDHCVLAWIADHDDDSVAVVIGLLRRARAAEPLR